VLISLAIIDFEKMQDHSNYCFNVFENALRELFRTLDNELLEVIKLEIE